MKEFKKLNKRALKIYYDYKQDNNYFNFQGMQFYLSEFCRLDTPWFSKEYIKSFPEYIHGIWYGGYYYIEIIEGYEPKVNIYEKSSKGI